MAFAYSRSITIDHTKVAGPRTDFAFLFRGTFSFLRAVGAGGVVRNASGYDIGFYAEAALTTKLDWEIEKWDSTTGEIVAWIRIPSLSDSVDTVIYVAVGNPAITTDQANPHGIWNNDGFGSGYRFVLHLPTGANKLKDSAYFGYNATAVGAPPNIAGQIGDGLSLNGSTQYLSASGTFLSVTGKLRMLMWFYPTSFVAGDLLHKDPNFLNYKMGMDATGHLVGGANTRDFAAAVSSVPMTLNAWNLLEAGWDGGPGNAKPNFVVLNKVRTNAGAAYNSGGYTGLDPLYIGADATPTPTIPGRMDEVRITTLDWSQDETDTHYANVTDPAFFALGDVSTVDFEHLNALLGVEGPLYWSVLAHRDVDGTPKRFPWSPISIADPDGYNDGYKDELMLSVGDISFPLSDRRGLIQVPTCDVTYSDLPGADGLMQLRGMLGRDAQRALRGKEFTLYCITDEARRQQLQPLIVFRGFVDRCDLSVDYQFVIHAKGWIAKRLSKKLWDDRIIDIFPEAPPETQERAVPVAFGVLSDEGSDAGPIVFVDDEAGRGGNGGASPVASYGDIAAAPTGLTSSEAVGMGAINLGDNPGDAYYVQVARVVAGVESDPMPFLPSSITPVVITADNAAIDAACDNDGADSYRFYIGRILTGQVKFSHYLETNDPVTGVRFTHFPTLASEAATPITPGGLLAVNPFAYVAVVAVMDDGTRTALFPGEFPDVASIFSAGYLRPVRLAITPLAGVDYYEFYFRRHPTNPFDKRFIVPTSQVNGNSDVYWTYDWSSSGYEVIAGAPVPSGVVTPVHVGKVKDLTGFEWDGFLLSGRPCWEYISAYLNGVRVDEGQYGGDLLAPGKPGYTARFGALPYTAGAYTPCMMFVTGPMAGRILGVDGFDQEAFRVNLKGHANVAVTDVETSLYEQLRMIAKNAVLTDVPSITGDFDQEPVFTDGTARLDDASLDQAAIDGLEVMEQGPGAQRWLAGDMTVDQFFQDIGPSGKLKVGIKPNGQMVVAVHNPHADATAELDERFDIVDRTFGIQVTDQGFANALPYEYADRYDELGNVTLQPAVTEEDAVSQSADRYDDREPDESMSLTWRRSAGMARGVALAHLRESRYMPQPARAESMLHSIRRSPGEVVAVTHRQGATATGYAQRKHAVLGMQIALSRFVVGLTLLDLGTRVGELSFFQYEAFMSQQWIGGSRHETCLTDGGVAVPFNWRPFRINWGEIPGTHGQRARIFSATAAGTVKPSIFLAGEDPSGDTSVVEGVTNATAVFDEQVLVIPRATGEVEYWMLPIAGGGATDADMQLYGFLEGYRI